MRQAKRGGPPQGLVCKRRGRSHTVWSKRKKSHMVWNKRGGVHHKVCSEKVYCKEVSLEACMELMELHRTCLATRICERCLELNCDWEC